MKCCLQLLILTRDPRSTSAKLMISRKSLTLADLRVPKIPPVTNTIFPKGDLIFPDRQLRKRPDRIATHAVSLFLA
jgi:hypothetical protein